MDTVHSIICGSPLGLAQLDSIVCCGSLQLEGEPLRLG